MKKIKPTYKNTIVYYSAIKKAIDMNKCMD